jgi:TPR repeat protein
MGIGYATAAIGEIYFRGLSDAGQDYNKAMEWLLKAADQGSYTAMNRIGHMYEMGKGVERNEETSKKWYTKAAEHGSVGAMNKIALLYHYNKKYNKAMEWLLKAAKHGDPASIRNIGILYAEGQGVEQNCKKAFSWYLKSSQYDNNYAEYQMKRLMRTNYNQMMAILRDLKHERKELKLRVTELERENEALKLRPPPEGGEFYLNTKRHFEDRVKKQKF